MKKKDLLGKYILVGKTPVEEPDLLKWAEWFGGADRKVAQTFIGLDLLVSTVFLGLDYNFLGGTRRGPVLFETMLFRKKNGKWDWSGEETIRAKTWEEAEENHNKMVKVNSAILDKRKQKE